MANIYDERSDEHAGFAAGTKIETTINHHEVNRDLAAQTQLTIVSVAHFPTRVIATNENGVEWTLPLHSVRILEPVVQNDEPDVDDPDNG
ncbi:MAG: hypothetical protein NZ771_06000 [Candidatus Marinimicrobia bacterium]|nr:hypothetical protein [Candidatus Neomarinimicrobiota bacterium]